MVTEYGKKHGKKDEAEIRELIGMAVGGDKQSFKELAEVNRNLIIEFLSNRVFRKALESVIVPKLTEETVEEAQKEITAIRHDDQKEIGKFFVRIARRTWKTNEIKKRMEQAVTGDQDALGELFKIYYNTLEDFFYERICGDSKNDHELPKGMSDLCEKTYKKAREKVNPEYPNNDLNYFDSFLRQLASNVWFDTAYRSNQGNDEAFNLLFLLILKPIEGFFRAKVGPNKRKIDYLCNETFLQVRINVKKYPYIPDFTIYQYFRNHAELVLKRYLISPDSAETFSKRRLWSNEGDDKASKEVDPDDLETEEPDPNIILIIQEKIKLALETLNFLATIGKPHQFVAFGYSKWLGWGSQAVVENCSDSNLYDLSKELFEETCKLLEGLINTTNLQWCFLPLFNKLDQVTNSIYPKNDPYLELSKKHGKKKVKDLVLKYFYKTRPKHNVTVWTNRLLKKATGNLEIKTKWNENPINVR